ncbi:unnamed protein product [Brachionus calyciflorus]|uniref:Uncharacterized protein n=1 Tax=Brachionus calyciflorus TaxID=104777 RepID=A0A813MA37_9BILA|nr:unnamed protein product [Brachionus calyciflorus]
MVVQSDKVLDQGPDFGFPQYSQAPNNFRPNPNLPYSFSQNNYPLNFNQNTHQQNSQFNQAFSNQFQQSQQHQQQQYFIYQQNQSVARPEMLSYSQILQNNEAQTQPINIDQVPNKQKTYTLKFKSNTRFDARLKDYFVLEAVFRKMKPNSDISTIYLNKNDELVIKTNIENELHDLRKWPTDAFGSGIEEIVKKQKFYLALHNVYVEFDIEAPRAKTELKNKYDIDDTLRMMKKSTGEKILLVKAVMCNQEKFNQIIKNGYIYLGCSRIRATQWRFSISPLQCFKCQKLGHRADNCKGQETCLKCGKHDHKREQCPFKDDPSKYHCVNCGGNHVACSKQCPVLKKAAEEKKQELDKKIKTSTRNTTRIYSNFSNELSSQQTIGLVKFIIDLIKNLSEANRAVNEDPSRILQSIKTYLGSDISNAVSNLLKMNKTKTNFLKFIHINSQSINNQNKRSQVEELITRHEADFVSINETFLSPKNILEFNNYNFIRSDRKDKRGGGVALGIKKSIKGEKIILNEFKEAAGFLTTLKNEEPLAIFSIYVSPKDRLDENLFDFIQKNYKNFLILGDLNSKSRSWYCKQSNENGKKLENIIDKYNFIVLNNQTPTYRRSQNVLDLSICSINLEKYFSHFEVLNDQIKNLDSDFDEPKEINTIYDLEKESDNILNQIKLALNNAKKEFLIKNKNKPFVPVPKNIVDLIRDKRKIRKIAKQSGLQEHKKIYNMISRKLSNLMKKFKNERLRNEFQELALFDQSSSKHWSLVKKLENKPSCQENSSEFLINNCVLNDNQKIAEAFAENLESIFKNSIELNVDKYIKQSTKFGRFEYISIKEVTEAIKTAKLNASPGPDLISNKVLKNLPFKVIKSLHWIFNYSLKLGFIPAKWKKSKIIMIPKKNKPLNQITSYRPISLLSCIAKILEKIINSKIQNWAENEKILPDCQAGFRKKRSTQEHIFRLTQAISHGFNKKQITVAIFFDLEKAFDKTPHEGILHKLKKLGLSSSILNWIECFLNNREFQVKFKDILSSLKKIDCGVPQGSCLSPTLFSLYFSAIVKIIPPEVKIALYADDLCIWYTGTSKREIKKILQKAINSILSFCKKWGLTINNQKTCYTTFTTAGLRKNYRKKYGFKFYIDKNIIPLEPNPTFLGITLDPKINFKEHLVSIEKKIIPKKNLIKKLKKFKWSDSLSTNIKLYKSLIRSLFDYCFVILNSGTGKIKGSLQKIQNKILKIIKFFPMRTSIKTIHQKLKLDLIEDRANLLFMKFIASKQNQEIIANEILVFLNDNQSSPKRFCTPLDNYFKN